MSGGTGARCSISPATVNGRTSTWTGTKTSQWLDSELGDVLLAWHDDQLVGYIGLSLPINGWSWVRLLGIRDGRMPSLVLRELCESR